MPEQVQIAMSMPEPGAAAAAGPGPYFAYFVEVLNRDGSVAVRQRFEALPIRIGRAYDNDVIVDDPYVASAHVVIEAGADPGELVARDLGTHNGIRVSGGMHRPRRHRRTPPARVVLREGAVLWVGHSALRVARGDQAVAPERVDHRGFAAEGMPAGLLGLALAALMGWFAAWMADTGTRQPSDYARLITVGLLALAFWCGAWSVLNRLLAGRARLGRHLLIGGTALMVMTVAEQVLPTVGYALSIGWPSMYRSSLIPLTLAAASYFHLSTIWPSSPATARRVAGALGFVVIGAFAIFKYAGNETIADAPYLTTLGPPGLRVTAPVGLDAFMSSLSSLQQRADARRAEKVGPTEGESD